jgi:hypothetical protein
MHHDDDVRAELKYSPVAGLLVSPVASVEFVADRLQAKFTSHGDRLVGAGVIDEHDLVDDVSV